MSKSKAEMEMKASMESARAVADLERGLILASVEVAALPATVFEKLASEDVTMWWVRPGVFDTREWSGEVRQGGAWRASGVGLRGPYVLEGDFVEIDRPRKLVHTWRSAGDPSSTTVTYRLDAVDQGTRLTLRHAGFASPATCKATCIGWETSFDRLQSLLAEG